MIMNKNTLILLTVSLVGTQAWAGSVTVPNTFLDGTTASASEVNANFDAVKTEVDDNDTRIANLQAAITSLQNTVTSLQNQLAAVQNNSVLALDGYLSLDTSAYGYQRALFSGVNVQVINGVDQTTINGLGNFIVGYNTPRDAGGFVCSDGQYTDLTTCESNSGIWLRSHKSGSHNIVAGDGNSYSQYGGVVFGSDNVINGVMANIAGGETNIASGVYSSVTGGSANEATGQYSSVSGGDSNVATGVYSSVGGGNSNEATGQYSSVSGGNSRNAPGTNDWAAGSLFEDF